MTEKNDTFAITFKEAAMTDETLYSIALCSIEGIGPCRAKEFVRTFGSAKALYELSPYDIAGSGITPGALRLFLDNRNASLETAEQEVKRMEDLGIQCYNWFDDNYPERLRQCDDSPLLLFTNNLTDLTTGRYIAVVGTRNVSDYGRTLTRSFVKELAEACPDITIVSGLAYGVDINAHRAALDFGLRTVGVVAHGLHTLYPATHRTTAQNLTELGGAVLSEFPTTVGAAPKNFLQRNRIVAGLCDAVVVIESAIRGGSLSTAAHANGYGRDVYAFPGRVGDLASEGCNHLIRTQRAQLITSASDLLDDIGWAGQRETRPADAMPAGLTEEESALYQLLCQSADPLHITVLMQQSGLPMHKLKSLLTKLEFKGTITQLAGEKYHKL